MDKKLFAELKVGDKVLVRDDLRVDSEYGNDSFVSGMGHFSGKVGTVARLRTSAIRLEEVAAYNWTPEMLVGKVITGYEQEEQKESVEPEKATHKYAVGDKVKIKNNAHPIIVNWDTGTTVTVVAQHGWFGQDDLFSKDGYPKYQLEDRDGLTQSITEVQLAPAETTEDTEKKHKYAVGQKVKVTANGHHGEKGGVWCCWSVGKEVTITELQGFYSNGEPEYLLVDAHGIVQYMPESQLESVDIDSNPLGIEAGKIYSATTDKGTASWIIDVTDIDSNKVYHKGALCLKSDFFDEDGWFFVDELAELTVATAEQEQQLLRAKVEEGILPVDVLPFDSPELEVGKIYMDDDGWIFRYLKGRKEVNYIHTSVGTAIDNFGDFSNLVKQGTFIHMHQWRIATAAEQKKLEDAEKAHGCNYSNAFVNEKGTVIHVGGYYVMELGKSLASYITKIAEITGNEIRILPELRLDGHWTDGSPWVAKGSTYLEDLRPATASEIKLYEKAIELKAAIEAVKSE